jgi:hypothetical protein
LIQFVDFDKIIPQAVLHTEIVWLKNMLCEKEPHFPGFLSILFNTVEDERGVVQLDENERSDSSELTINSTETSEDQQISDFFVNMTDTELEALLSSNTDVYS